MWGALGEGCDAVLVDEKPPEESISASKALSADQSFLPCQRSSDKDKDKSPGNGGRGQGGTGGGVASVRNQAKREGPCWARGFGTSPHSRA